MHGIHHIRVTSVEALNQIGPPCCSSQQVHVHKNKFTSSWLGRELRALTKELARWLSLSDPLLVYLQRLKSSFAKQLLMV
jgi:hypothetical protein